ncbi:hypothetical protein DQQ10_00045 [Pseudochryseolinea flava]|uniref:Uncharacterized protein n=2 Tax=Pseudochryseolinea flava TaxID=2059302 RepID=A0A364Y6F3_9BACT|nr:hypothetical protein DQQ10_00045 [Pseudochryseolinea flava]
MSIQSIYQLGVIGYFQVNKTYIAEVLCINKDKPLLSCHGKCFLKRNLNERDKTDTARALGKNKVEIPTFIVTEACTLLLRCATSYVTNSTYTTIYAFTYTPFTFHPPCCPLNKV